MHPIRHLALEPLATVTHLVSVLLQRDLAHYLL